MKYRRNIVQQHPNVFWNKHVRLKLQNTDTHSVRPPVCSRLDSCELNVVPRSLFLNIVNTYLSWSAVFHRATICLNIQYPINWINLFYLMIYDSLIASYLMYLLFFWTWNLVGKVTSQFQVSFGIHGAQRKLTRSWLKPSAMLSCLRCLTFCNWMCVLSAKIKDPIKFNHTSEKAKYHSTGIHLRIDRLWLDTSSAPPPRLNHYGWRKDILSWPWHWMVSGV